MNSPDDVQTPYLDSIVVKTEAEDVIAYSKAISVGQPDFEADKVPHTYPFRWIADSRILAAVQEYMVQMGFHQQRYPIHIEQQISLNRELEQNETYHLSAKPQGPDRRGQVFLNCEIREPSGAVVGTMKSTFLLLKSPGEP